MSAAARVLVAQMSHETNTFNPVLTTLDHFRACSLFTGAEVVGRFAGSDSELGGFIDALRAGGAAPLGAVAASCIPSGPVSARTIEWIEAQIVETAVQTRPDGILLALHGAMVGEGGEGTEVHLLRRLRGAVGPDLPIVCTLDLHANVPDELLDLAQAFIPYDTNPHRDLRERGLEAAALLLKLLAGAVRPVSGLARIPLLLSPVNQGTAAGPMAEVMAAAREWEGQPGILNVGVLPGFPFADVPDAGFAVLVTADGDRERAEAAARAVAAVAWGLRERFLPHLPSPAQALAEARAAGGRGPVVVAEVTDNVNAGAPGDGTHLLAALLAAPVPGAVLAAIADPAAVAAALAIGVGRRGLVTVGGKTSPLCGPPVELNAYVRLASDGRFLNLEANNGAGMLKGFPVEMGRTVVLEVPAAALTVIVTERRVPPIGPELFRSLGIEPAAVPVLGVKTRAHYWQDYPFVQATIEVEAPGLATTDLSHFPYRRLRRPKFPLDREAAP